MNKIPSLFIFTGCRLYQEIIKSRFNEIVPIYHFEDISKVDSKKFILFFEYVGNNIKTLDTVNSLLSQFENKEIMIVIDDTYEGLTSEEFLLRFKEIEESNKNLVDWVLLSSNNRIRHTMQELFGSCSNFMYFNIHLFMPEYDNVIPSKINKNINDGLRKKKFICVNRQERSHRLQTIDFLAKHDMLKHTYASCVLGDYAALLYDDTNFKAHNPQVEQYQDINLSKLVLDIESKARLKNILPLDIDIKEHQNKLFATNMPDLAPFFRESYFSIITEGDFNSHPPKQQFTEKILKSVVNHHPFIIIGLPYTLDLLKDHGFLTFSKYIDESYDKEEDSEKRMSMALIEIKKLNQMNMHQMHRMYIDLLPILEHNYQTYLNIFNTNQPTKLVSRIIDWYYNDKEY